MTSEVLVDASEGILTITINRPEARNAMTLSAATAIAAALDELDARDDLRIGILTGAGGTFCAGMDLKGFLRGERPSIPGRGFGGLTRKPPAKRAYEYGLVNRLVPVGQALEEARRLAATIAGNGPLSVAASKRVIVEQQDWSTEEMWDRQAAITEHVFTSQDAREGSAAFAEKRKPVWQGK